MSTTTNTVLVKHHLKSLKLPTMSNECEKVASRAAGDRLILNPPSLEQPTTPVSIQPSPSAALFDRPAPHVSTGTRTLTHQSLQGGFRPTIAEVPLVDLSLSPARPAAVLEHDVHKPKADIP